MKKMLLIVSVLIIYTSNAQVGIGTTTPKANLDISASNPSAPIATDGLLIPRVTAFPTPVTAAQNGMLVFLTTAIGINQVGLYFYDFPTATWKWIASGSNPYVWGNNITNTRIEVPKLSDGITPRPAGNEVVITDSGNFGIGTNTPTKSLVINQKNTNDGFLFTGQSIWGAGTGTGFIASLGVNVSGNKQLWLGDPDYLGLNTGAFTRYGVYGGGALLDAVQGDGGLRAKLYLGVSGDINSGIISSNTYINGGLGVGSLAGTAALNGTLPTGSLSVDGKVGIGTIAPVSKLEINDTSSTLRELRVVSEGINNHYPNIDIVRYTGASSFLGHPFYSQSLAGGTAATPLVAPASSTVAAHIGYGYSNGSFKEIGRLNFGTSSTFSNSDTSANFNLYLNNGTLGVARFSILSNGFTGIDNATPTEKLDVTGNVKFSGALMPNNLSGTTGDILSSAGAGNAPIWNSKTTLLANEWHLTGNTGTTAGTNFIGTSDAKDFITKTNGLERMRIDSNGNVGIGTTNPQAKLHVTNGSDGEMLLEGTNKGRLLAFSGGGFWIESGTSYTSGSVDDIVFSGMLGWPEWMRIKSTGNIGIGTSAPTEKLDVSGNIKLSGAFKPNNLAGTIGEILTSAGAGAAPTWSSKTVKPYITTGVATGIYTVSLSEYTIRVFGTISEIRLPNAVGNLGKTYIIIGSNGITSKIFSTAGGVIYDDVTNVFITTITSGQRYMVQSDGSDWIVIGR